MELELVTFEQAKVLKELGFPQNIYTPKVYLEKTIPHDIIAKECGLSDWQCVGGKLIPCSSDYNKYGVDTCSCPTLELVAKWLRKQKNIHIELTLPNPAYCPWWHCVLRDIKTRDIIAKTISYEKDEQALSAGIDEAIKYLKVNNYDKRRS